jgi:hypothetical protein
MLCPRRHRDPDYALRLAGQLYGGSARTEAKSAIAALHRYDGGHLELLTAPEVLVPVIEEFLDR